MEVAFSLLTACLNASELKEQVFEAFASWLRLRHGISPSMLGSHPLSLTALSSLSAEILSEASVNGIMYPHRLERVARCTGSPIISSDKPFSEKLKPCESLYFDKVVEEHAIVGEGGKKPCKTLMFLEGCPTRLGCTRIAEIAEREKGPKPWKRECPLPYFLCSDPLPFPRPTSFLRKNPGGGAGKVPLRSLYDKCVGLYLCQTGSLIPTLDEIQKKCCLSGLEFEVILVYMPLNDFGDPKLFQERINSALEERNISWWVLPFVNWVSRRLWRLCHKDSEDRLIVIGHRAAGFVELHGEAVIRHFGISAYPFSRELLLNREFERLKSVTLESLLVYRSRDYVRWTGSGFSDRVPVAALRTKNVLLYLHCVSDHSDKVLNNLISYCETKLHDPDLEVVFVGLDKTSFHDFGSSCAMPWLVCPFDSEHADFVTRTIFGKAAKYTAIVAFRKDGSIFSLSAQQLVCSSCSDFPFSDNLYNEMTAELAGNHQPVLSLITGSEMDDRDSHILLFRPLDNLIVLLPLLEKDYFFPGVPLGGRMNPADKEDFSDNADEDERDKFFASKIDYSGPLEEFAQYPNEIQEKIPNIDTRNFDVVSFLSADNRPYLVRNDKCKTQFDVENLRDKKLVMICCFFCPVFSNSPESKVCRGVSHVCSELYDEYGDSFEMVLVFKMRRDFQIDKSAFNHMLSGFRSSCLFVPFKDSHSRDSICRSLGFNYSPTGLFLRADKAEVIWHKSLYDFQSYGVDAFPFTEEDLDKTSVISWNSQPLENLFRCASSTILHKSECKKGGADCCETTSIEQLKEKIVGVYLCFYGDFIPMLHGLSECCKANNIEFEIVLVYCPFSARTPNAELFQEQINRALEKRKISWWVLPFKSWVSLRLKRLCLREIDEELIIVSKGVVDPYGSYFINQYEQVLRPDQFFNVNVSRVKQKVLHEFKARYLVPRNRNFHPWDIRHRQDLSHRGCPLHDPYRET